MIAIVWAKDGLKKTRSMTQSNKQKMKPVGSLASFVPITLGMAVILGSLAAGNDVGVGIGIVGALAGIGVMAFRIAISGKQQTEPEQPVDERQGIQREQGKCREELKQLEASLVLDGDARTETALRALCRHYDDFQEKVGDGELTAAGYEVTHRVEELFQACINQLRRSHELWEQAHDYRGDARRAVLDERDDIVQEVVVTTDHINHAVDQFRRINARRDETDLASLREELDESLRVARVVEERMAAWETPLGGGSETDLGSAGD